VKAVKAAKITPKKSVKPASLSVKKTKPIVPKKAVDPSTPATASTVQIINGKKYDLSQMHNKVEQYDQDLKSAHEQILKAQKEMESIDSEVQNFH